MIKIWVIETPIVNFVSYSTANFLQIGLGRPCAPNLSLLTLSFVAETQQMFVGNFLD